jgi:hypothetical protein
MSQFQPAQFSFSDGEQSPLMLAADIGKQIGELPVKAAVTLENFTVLTEGGIARRRGTTSVNARPDVSLVPPLIIVLNGDSIPTPPPYVVTPGVFIPVPGGVISIGGSDVTGTPIGINNYSTVTYEQRSRGGTATATSTPRTGQQIISGTATGTRLCESWQPWAAINSVVIDYDVYDDSLSYRRWSVSPTWLLTSSGNSCGGHEIYLPLFDAVMPTLPSAVGVITYWPISLFPAGSYSSTVTNAYDPSGTTVTGTPSTDFTVEGLVYSDSGGIAALLAGAGGTWGAWGAVPSFPTATATYDARTALTFDYIESGLKASFTGLPALIELVVVVAVGSSPQSNPDLITYTQTSITFTADSSGEAEWEIQITPNAAGFDYWVDSVAYYLP